MAGHSKWANIKRKKEKTDAQRGKIFTKIGREIAVAVKHGGPDPDANPRLRDAIASAKAANMPNDNIMRSIKKASGDGENVNYEEVFYEGYGPGGTAVIVEALTDNRNRTGSDMRYCFDKFGGNLGAMGCVAWMFNKEGIITIEKDGKIDEESLMMAAIDAGAQDFSVEDEYFEILTEPAGLSKVRDELEKQGYVFASADVEMVPTTTVKIEEAKTIESMEKFLDLLDEFDDVQNVWHNWEQDE